MITHNTILRRTETKDIVYSWCWQSVSVRMCVGNGCILRRVGECGVSVGFEQRGFVGLWKPHLRGQNIAANATGIKEVNKKNKMRYCPINRNCLKKAPLPEYAVNFFLFISFNLMLSVCSFYFFFLFRGEEKKFLNFLFLKWS